MGDRGNLTLKYGDKGEVNVYVHWLGSELPTLVAEALAKRWRWDDDSYLARIIIARILKENGIDDETGVGIFPTNAWQEGGPVVDLENQTVTLEGHWGGDSTEAWKNSVLDATYTYEQYIQAVSEGPRWDADEDD